MLYKTIRPCGEPVTATEGTVRRPDAYLGLDTNDVTLGCAENKPNARCRYLQQCLCFLILAMLTGGDSEIARSMKAK